MLESHKETNIYAHGLIFHRFRYLEEETTSTTSIVAKSVIARHQMQTLSKMIGHSTYATCFVTMS